MKVASACVKALSSPSFSQKEFCLLLREYARGALLAGHVIKLKFTRIHSRGNTLAAMERRPFPVYRRCGDDGG